MAGVFPRLSNGWEMQRNPCELTRRCAVVETLAMAEDGVDDSGTTTAPLRRRVGVFLRGLWPLGVLRMVAALAVIAVIVFQGERQMREKIAIVKPIEYIGHADEASYA